MKQLWSPWRSRYIETLQHPKGGCECCRIDKINQDDKTFIVSRHKYNYVVMNLYPYNSGHLLIVPYEHVDDTTLLPPETLNEMMQLIQYSMKALKSAFSPAGFNVGLNIGAAAGAGITDHVHFHVVPRWKGDTNFLPVLGDTKLISQDLKESYEKVKSEFQKIIP